MDFAVKYGPIPFTITELYTPGKEVGLYSKNADMPGGKLLTLPTVLVDVEEDYSAMTLYSCLEIGGQAVRELVIATKDENVDDTYVQELVDNALAAGVDIEPDSIKKVSCK